MSSPALLGHASSAATAVAASDKDQIRRDGHHNGCHREPTRTAYSTWTPARGVSPAPLHVVNSSRSRRR
jgi:hypothetical protein